MNGKIGTLTGAQHGEKAQGNKTDTIKMAVSMAQQFTGNFGCSIRANRLKHKIIFGPGKVWINAINAAGRSKDKLFNCSFFCKLKQIERAGNTYGLVEFWILEAWPHACACGKVNYYIEVIANLVLKKFFVTDIALQQFKAGVSKRCFKILFFCSGS